MAPPQDSATGSKSNGHHRIHGLVLSFPTQGHVTPLTQFSRRLCHHGLAITLVVNDHTAARSPRSPANRQATWQTPVADDDVDPDRHFHFISVPDGLPPHHPRDRSFDDQVQSMQGMRAAVEGLITNSSAAGSSGGPVNFIIADVFVTWAFDVATAFGLPFFTFYTANATSGSALYHTRHLMSKGILPFRQEDLESETAIDCIPGVLPLRPREFTPSMQLPDTTIPRFQMTLQMFEHVPESAGLVLNTVYELEKATIDALRDEIPGGVFPIGPLLLPAHDNDPLPTESELTFWAEDDRCLTWLDGRKQASVLYISFGSIAAYRDEARMAQFKELAAGLEASEVAFLWVIRRDALQGRPLSKALPEGFLDRTKDRGLIVSWAPQLRVLTHEAVGGFLTHCGWNSILESLGLGGVPMLCWPDIADQMVNRRLLVDQWKVGMEFTETKKIQVVSNGGEVGKPMKIVGKEEVESVVRRLMVAEEGRDMRRRAAELKNLLRGAVKQGGSSGDSLGCLLGKIRGIFGC